MKGIIMAGGAGSRLRPLTCDLPKPMVPIMNQPVMAYGIKLLRKHGIKEIGVTLQYRPEQIMDYFCDGSEYGVRLHYFIEEIPLGTAGSVKNAGDFIDQPFVVVSGDALTDVDLKSAIEFHKRNKSVATLILKRIEVPLDYGVVVTSQTGRIIRFLEKPNWSEVFSDTVNTGIYILDPRVMDYFDLGVKFDFSQDLFPILLEKKEPIYGYVTDEYWCDIGNCNTYLTAHYDMLSGRINHKFECYENNKGIFLGKAVNIHKDARIESPCYIGNYSCIEEGAHIGPYTVIGEHCKVDKYASIKRSVLWDHVSVGKYAEIRGAVICRNVVAHDRVSVFEGAAIGDRCHLMEGTTIKPQIKIWPEKTIEEGSIVRSNIVWGKINQKNLFGMDGIRGLGNIMISPNTISRIGASIGAFMGHNKRIAVSCDNHPGNVMLKYSLISGLLSTGTEVFDLGLLNTPVLRYSVRRLGLDAGIHLFASDGTNAHIHVLDSTGNNLSPQAERKIEFIYIQEDYPIKEFQDIKQLKVLHDMPIFYIRSLMDEVNTQAIIEKGFRILVKNNGSRIDRYLLHQVLNELNCEVIKCNNDLEKEISSGRLDFGCSLDYNGESINLYNENGTPISREEVMTLIALIYMKEKPKTNIVVPYTAPNIIDELAKKYDCRIVRTKSNKHAIMREASGSGIFFPYFDGIALLIKIIERMALDNISFSELIEEIPEFYVKEKEIPCSWNKKGTVMRCLIEETREGEAIEMFEGVKIGNDRGWALIIPDVEKPVCRVYSEGFSEEYAEELASFFEKRIISIQENELSN